MKYTETLEYLFSQLPMYHRVGNRAYKANLNNSLYLDSITNSPHRNFKSVHIAGTNGKGSVSHMIASVLQSAGYKTGLYTSPHLKDFRERIRVNGIPIPQNYVIQFVEKYKSAFEKIHPSFFEMTVALAFDYFSFQNVDIAVVETGLGGRLDSTNIITPILSIITNISLDHTELLGNTVEKIAIEKAGIIKKNVPVVVGESNVNTKIIFIDKAIKIDAPIYFADDYYSVEYSLQNLEGNQVFKIFKNNLPVYQNLATDLNGLYQQKNIVTALCSIDNLIKSGLKISEANIYEGIATVSASTGLQGRWQKIGNNPLIICDTGHNIAGITEVVKQIKNTPYISLHIVFGMVNDKDHKAILKLLPPEAKYYFTKANIPRSLDENTLKNTAKEFGLKGESFSTVSEALEAAKLSSSINDLIFVGGSTFVVAEVL